MAEIIEDDEKRAKLRRSVTQELSRMEDDFDKTRELRQELVDKLMVSAKSVLILDDKGNTREDTDTGVRLINATLKALSDVEKANSQAITLKLKQNEQAIASSAASKDRIAIILQATKPGQIIEDFPAEQLEEQLENMFGADIKDFEMKESPRDLDD